MLSKLHTRERPSFQFSLQFHQQKGKKAATNLSMSRSTGERAIMSTVTSQLRRAGRRSSDSPHTAFLARQSHSPGKHHGCTWSPTPRVCKVKAIGLRRLVERRGWQGGPPQSQGGRGACKGWEAKPEWRGSQAWDTALHHMLWQGKLPGIKPTGTSDLEKRQAHSAS